MLCFLDLLARNVIPVGEISLLSSAMQSVLLLYIILRIIIRTFSKQNIFFLDKMNINSKTRSALLMLGIAGPFASVCPHPTAVAPCHTFSLLPCVVALFAFISLCFGGIRIMRCPKVLVIVLFLCSLE